MDDHLFKLAQQVLTFLDPERAHGLTIRALKLGRRRSRVPWIYVLYHRKGRR